MPRTFRHSVSVTPTEAGRERHNEHSNPHVGWIFISWPGEVSETFKRKRDAMKAAEAKLGKIDWRRLEGGRMEGSYGPHYTADEWLAKCQQPGEQR